MMMIGMAETVANSAAFAQGFYDAFSTPQGEALSIAYSNEGTGNNGACFIAGTLVPTDDGFISIENICVGNSVYSTDIETGEKDLKKVTQIFIKETDQLVHIDINGQTITTTPEHPFYVPTKGWTEAGQLREGDELVQYSDKKAIIENVKYENLKSPISVYNIEVEDWHTYYVSKNMVLVHNTCKKQLPSLDSTGKVHGELPRPQDIGDYSHEELQILYDELRISVQTRIQYNTRLGSDPGHALRQAQEQQLIWSIAKILGIG
jgi:hypothetical protein